MSATGTKARPKNEQKSDLSRALAPLVESLSATLWAFLFTVTKVSRYVPHDLLVE